MVEHIALFVVTFKSYKEKYIRLYKQFEFELRLRTILAIIYKIKIFIYKKVIIFSFIYSSTFIIFQFVKIIYLRHYVDAFYFSYFINT